MTAFNKASGAVGGASKEQEEPSPRELLSGLNPNKSGQSNSTHESFTVSSGTIYGSSDRAGYDRIVPTEAPEPEQGTFSSDSYDAPGWVPE